MDRLIRKNKGIRIYSLTFAVLVPLLITVLGTELRGRLSEKADTPDTGTNTVDDVQGGEVGSEMSTASRHFFAGSSSTWRSLPLFDPRRVDSETLWLARCIYSETKRPEEMELVAWVVRNRVETKYRGRTTYRSVVLDPLQFSAFNMTSEKRHFYMNLRPSSSQSGWSDAVRVAHYVRFHTGEGRPLPLKTRHFYSEVSMRGTRHPYWAKGERPVRLSDEFDIDARRFRFYEGIM